jgi:imidazolonepropionase-like amidohydrolase
VPFGTVIRDVRVFDGHRLGEPATVVLDGPLISSGAPDPGHTEVDGGGATLLPGLIDTHVHIDRRGELRTAAEWGVTTVLDMGTSDPAKLAALRGEPGLPTLLSAGSLASAPGSRFVKSMGYRVSTTVDGPGDAARFVTERAAEGSDYIKIAVEDPKIPGSKALPPETVAAIVAEAHRAGLLTVAHVVSAATLATAIQANVDVVTHTALTSDPGPELATLLAERRVVIIPTLTMMDAVVRTIGGKLLMRVLGSVVPGMRMDYAYAKATVTAFRTAGMTVLAGTDANDNPAAPYQPSHGIALHEELARLVDAGLTPVEALQAATAHAAATFGLTDRGVVAPGAPRRPAAGGR